MPTVTPVWVDAQTVIAVQVLARGSTARGTIDLRGSFGALMMAKIGRGGTTALSGGIAGVDVLFRRVLNNDSAVVGGVHPAGMPALLSSTVAASSTTQSTVTASTLGTPTLNVASITGFAGGDIICIQDGDAGVTRVEWHRISKVATGVITLDRNLQFTHTINQAGGQDTIRNKADVFAPVWCPGGSLYEVIFDYGDDTAGDSVVVSCYSQSYGSDLIT